MFTNSFYSLGYELSTKSAVNFTRRELAQSLRSRVSSFNLNTIINKIFNFRIHITSIFWLQVMIKQKDHYCILLTIYRLQ